MARMFPRSVQFRRSAAETAVFPLLKRALSDDYTVLHHVQWLQKDVGGTARDGEADFLIAHPKKGALALEVKGGEVRYDASEGAWVSRSRDGKDHGIKDPFEQAKDAKYSLRRFLRDQSEFPRNWGPFGHGACFPDAVLSSQSVPHADPAIAIDARDMDVPLPPCG